MSNYNFSALDDKEFELLVCDLLTSVLDQRVERFKPGKDQGVDGRWFATDDREGIVQCKHWMRSGFPALLKTLSKKERPKIVRLNPARYILATSVELSRQNKKQVFNVLKPFVKAESDILGLEDIEDLLSRNTDVEKRHYKLWLSSSTVLNHVFNNAVIGRSESDAEAMEAKFRFLVKTKVFEEAAKILEKRNTVIITGAPGIGKTTLAEQLIVEHLVDDYELVTMREITDGESLFSKEKKQIFYFDDFLGRNMLEALKLQHDSQIVGFIRRVYRDKLKRFVLTSRSSILNQGKHLSDLFNLEKTEKSEYEVRIEKLSRFDKARILYSHVWHSTMSDGKLEELFEEKRYRIIVDHQNFNPRLISFITDGDKSETLRPDEYWSYVTDTLANPKDLWRHYFGQVSHDCRDLAYLVVLNGRSISECRLRQAFRSLRSNASGGVGRVEHEAMVALKICTGSLLNRNIEPRGHGVTYDLYNPSIADYVLRVVDDWDVFAGFFSALRTVPSLRHLKEMLSTAIVTEDSYVRIVDYLVSELGEQDSSEDYLIELYGMTLENERLFDRHKTTVDAYLNSLLIAGYVGSDEVLMKVFIAALNKKIISDPNQTIDEIYERVKDWPLGLDELPLLGELVGFGEGDYGTELIAKAKKLTVECWRDLLRDYLDEAELLAGIFNEEQFEEGKEELASEIKTKLAETGLDFENDEVQAVCNEVSMHDIVDRNIDWDRGSDDEPYHRPQDEESEVADSVIDDMFERDLPLY